jgi:hypothetical protein
MPALTHGRTKNGFNQYARTISFGQLRCKKENGETRNHCLKGLCCGTPIQPIKYGNFSRCSRGLCRVPTTTGNRDRAIASGGVGSRSFGNRRAIGRRVQTRNQLPLGSDKNQYFSPTIAGYNPRTGVTNTFGAECEAPGCGCCLPTQPIPAPRNGFNFVIY